MVDSHTDLLLRQLEIAYISVMKKFTPELQRWIQYIEFEVDDKDRLRLKFKSSQEPIYFEISTKAFSSGHGPIELNYNETYEFFKKIKNMKLGAYA